MKPRTIASTLCLVALAFAAIDLAVSYPRLPDTVASHWGIDNRPNGWMSKGAFAATFAGTLALTGGLLMAVILLMRRMPAKWINLPHKDYWLAPERREATWAFLSAWLLVFNAAVLAFLAAILHLSLRANLDGTQMLSRVTDPMIVIFFAFTGIWTVRLLIRFRKPKPPEPAFPAPPPG